MAHVSRSAKSASNWTIAELIAYNITVTLASPADFFQSSANPSLDHLDSAILTASNGRDINLSKATADYLGYLDLATRTTQESFLADFATATLKLLGFNERHTTVATRYNMPLTICGETLETITDVCVISHPFTLLVVLVVGRPFFGRVNVEAQLIAQAIAAFQFNNAERSARGKPALEVMTIPCIIMRGTTPAFYLVPVTMELSNAVRDAQYPTSQTQVLRCVTVGDPPMQKLRNDGMRDTEFRELALKRLVAFKSLAKSHWQQLLA